MNEIRGHQPVTPEYNDNAHQCAACMCSFESGEGQEVMCKALGLYKDFCQDCVNSGRHNEYFSRIGLLDHQIITANLHMQLL